MLILSGKQGILPPDNIHMISSKVGNEAPLHSFRPGFSLTYPQEAKVYWVKLKPEGSIAKKMPFAMAVCMPGTCSTEDDTLINLAEAAKPDPTPKFTGPPASSSLPAQRAGNTPPKGGEAAKREPNLPSNAPPSQKPTPRSAPPSPTSVRTDNTPPKGGDPDKVVIDVTVKDVPGDYDDQQLRRLILSSMRGVVADRVQKIEVRSREGLVGKGEVTVRRDAVTQLTFAGAPTNCGPGLTACQVEIALKEWLLDVGALPPGQAFALLPAISLDTGDKRPVDILRRLHIEIDSLEQIFAQPPERTIIRVYLFDETTLRVELKDLQPGAYAPLIQISGSAKSRGLRLTKVSKRPTFELEVATDVVATREAPRVAVGTGSPDKPAPAPKTASPDPKPVTSRQHIVLKPAVPALPGWTQARATKRLKQLLDNAAYRAESADGASAAGVEPISLTKAGDGVIVWSALHQQSDKPINLPRLPEGISWSSRGSAAASTASPTLHDARIKPNDLVSFLDVEIAVPYLYEKWTLQLEPFNRSYRKEIPDTSNERCSLSLNAPNEGPIRLEPRTVNNRKVLRASVNPANLTRLEGKKITLTVTPTDKDATCAQLSADLDSTTRWSLSEEGLDGVRSTRALVNLRGRWLLGLYASQDLGAGGLASENVLRETRYEVFKQFVAYLERTRGQHFRDTPPASSTLGFDLALLRSSGVASDFQEPSVVLGKFRTPATNAFRLDAEAERRLIAFMEAASSESPPTFPMIGQEIRRYSGLFDELKDEGYPPAAIYLGAATPVSNSCRQWRDLAQGVDALSGRPRVFAILFANVSATQIGRDIGPEAKPVSLATLTRGYACEAGAGSAMLFVPFSDLTTRDSTTLLQAIFDQIDRWLARPP